MPWLCRAKMGTAKLRDGSGAVVLLGALKLALLCIRDAEEFSVLISLNCPNGFSSLAIELSVAVFGLDAEDKRASTSSVATSL